MAFTSDATREHHNSLAKHVGQQQQDATLEVFSGIFRNWTTLFPLVRATAIIYNSSTNYKCNNQIHFKDMLEYYF